MILYCKSNNNKIKYKLLVPYSSHITDIFGFFIVSVLGAMLINVYYVLSKKGTFIYSFILNGSFVLFWIINMLGIIHNIRNNKYRITKNISRTVKALAMCNILQAPPRLSTAEIKKKLSEYNNTIRSMFIENDMKLSKFTSDQQKQINNFTDNIISQVDQNRAQWQLADNNIRQDFDSKLENHQIQHNQNIHQIQQEIEHKSNEIDNLQQKVQSNYQNLEQQKNTAKDHYNQIATQINIVNDRLDSQKQNISDNNALILQQGQNIYNQLAEQSQKIQNNHQIAMNSIQNLDDKLQDKIDNTKTTILATTNKNSQDILANNQLLKDNRTDLGNQIKDLTDTMNSKVSSINNTINNHTTTLNNNIIELQGQIHNHEIATETKLNKTANDLRAHTNITNTKLAAMQGQIATAENSIDTIRNEFNNSARLLESAVNNQISTVKNDINNLDTKIDITNNSISSNQNLIISNSTEINALKNSINDPLPGSLLNNGISTISGVQNTHINPQKNAPVLKNSNGNWSYVAFDYISDENIFLYTIWSNFLQQNT